MVATKIQIRNVFPLYFPLSLVLYGYSLSNMIKILNYMHIHIRFFFFFFFKGPLRKRGKGGVALWSPETPPNQMIAMWDWRQRFRLGSHSHHCPLQRSCVKRTSWHSLAQTQRICAFLSHDRQLRSKMCLGNITVSCAARLLQNGFEHQVHSTCAARTFSSDTLHCGTIKKALLISQWVTNWQMKANRRLRKNTFPPCCRSDRSKRHCHLWEKSDIREVGHPSHFPLWAVNYSFQQEAHTFSLNIWWPNEGYWSNNWLFYAWPNWLPTDPFG